MGAVLGAHALAHGALAPRKKQPQPAHHTQPPECYGVVVGVCVVSAVLALGGDGGDDGVGGVGGDGGDGRGDRRRGETQRGQHATRRIHKPQPPPRARRHQDRLGAHR